MDGVEDEDWQESKILSPRHRMEEVNKNLRTKAQKDYFKQPRGRRNPEKGGQSSHNNLNNYSSDQNMTKSEANHNEHQPQHYQD